MSACDALSGCRIIIVESTYTSEFGKYALTFLDKLANRLRSNGLMESQNNSLHFRTDAEWRKLFASFDLEVVESKQKGTVIHRQVAYLLENGIHPSSTV